MPIEVLPALRRKVAELSQGRFSDGALDVDARIWDRGYLDSITHVQLLAWVEATWGVRVPAHRLGGSLATLAALAAHVEANGPRAPHG